MFLGHTNLKIRVSVNANNLTYAESLNQGKKLLKVDILHKLKKFGKELF